MTKTTEASKNTPLMEQYFAIKQSYPDTLLFFQVGDFYELFFDDARQAASFLALTLTKRGKNKGEDIPLCGVPVHAVNHYLVKLIKGGFRVALCNQLEKPQPGTVVKRGVTQVFTPGTLIDEQLLDTKSASYLLSFYPGKTTWALVFTELLTAQLHVTCIPAERYKTLESELVRFFPDEIIIPRAEGIQPIISHFKSLGYATTLTYAHKQLYDESGNTVAQTWIATQFDHKSQECINKHEETKLNLSMLYKYLSQNQPTALAHFKSIHFYRPDDYLMLDASTQKNLEIITNTHDQTTQATLYHVLDRAQTAMGSRTIKKWLQRPLLNQEAIVHRQEIIQTIISQPDLLMYLEEQLKCIADLERIIGRIALQKATIRDFIALKDSLLIIPDLRAFIATRLATYLGRLIQEKLHDFSLLYELLHASINDDQAQEIIIKQGFNHELDQLRYLVTHAQEAILTLELSEIEKTGINSLKIRYNNINGYYIEITNTHTDIIPSHYKHIQTLVNRKRFTTPELQTLEHDIIRAQAEIDNVEQMVYEGVKNEVYNHLSLLRSTAHALSLLDALVGLSRAAYDYHYVAPTFNNDNSIIIRGSRHPVIEQSLGPSFIKNDVTITPTNRLIILTGPNMGGKSTYLRQIALTSIMAQIGSFVPAASAELPIIDRIFTRIGSGDNLAQGKSTFFVEMEETATICTQATNKSLVILDEVGRGTSTHDGMALAHAIIEYIAQQIGAACLFATHYHELTTLENTILTVKNYHTQCIEQEGTVIFTHLIKPGPITQSFGIEVAKRAHLPVSIIQRAQQILQETTSVSPISPASAQSSFRQEFIQKTSEEDALIIKQISELDLNTITPKQAFDILWEFKSSLAKR